MTLIPSLTIKSGNTENRYLQTLKDIDFLASEIKLGQNVFT